MYTLDIKLDFDENKSDYCGLTKVREIVNTFAL